MKLDFNKNRLPANAGKPKKKVPAWKPITLLASTLAAVAIYEVAAYYVVTWMFWVYFALLFAVSIAYVLYNRGFSRWFIKPEMLPQNWEESKKEKFFADSRRWKKQSEWLLYIMLPLLVTYIVDFLLILWEEFTFSF